MIKLLVKNRLRGFVSGMLKQGKQGSKKKMALFAVLFAYIFVSIAALSGGISYTLGNVLIPSGMSWLYFSIFNLASLSVVFVLSIFETKSELFECKDNDLLLSMPIPEKALVISRSIVVLVFNYIVEAVVILPAIVVYAVISHDVIGVIGAIIVSLFIVTMDDTVHSADDLSAALGVPVLAEMPVIDAKALDDGTPYIRKRMKKYADGKERPTDSEKGGKNA